MTEQINTPELRFLEFKDEWYQSNLDEMCSFTSGGTPSRKINKYWDGDIPWITTSDLNNKFIKNIFTKITSSGLKNSSAKLITEPAIILAMYGQGKTRGKCSILNFPATTNQACAILQPNEFNNIEFVYQFIEKNYTYLRAQSNEGSQKNLSLSLLKKIKINYPSLFEQNKISDFFSKLDRQIELEEEKLELLEQQKRGYMQKIFSQELRFKDDNGNEYPEWQFKNLGELGETFTGLSGKTKDDFGYGDGLFITYMNVFKNTIAKSDMVERVKIGSNENQNRVQYGDILFTTSSEVPNEVGMSSIWLFNQDNVYLNSFCFGFRVVVNYIKPVYLARYLRSEEMRKTITILAQGSTRFNISKKEMMKLNIKVPYIEEQIKIDNFFNKIDILILKQSKKIEILKHRKKGLLQKMFV